MLKRCWKRRSIRLPSCPMLLRGRVEMRSGLPERRPFLRERPLAVPSFLPSFLRRVHQYLLGSRCEFGTGRVVGTQVTAAHVGPASLPALRPSGKTAPSRERPRRSWSQDGGAGTRPRPHAAVSRLCGMRSEREWASGRRERNRTSPGSGALHARTFAASGGRAAGSARRAPALALPPPENENADSVRVRVPPPQSAASPSFLFPVLSHGRESVIPGRPSLCSAVSPNWHRITSHLTPRHDVWNQGPSVRLPQLRKRVLNHRRLLPVHTQRILGVLSQVYFS